MKPNHAPAGQPLPRALVGTIARRLHLLLATMVLAGCTSGAEPDEPGATHAMSVRPTGSLVQPRAGHTTTRLSDGTVLMVGGYADGNLVWAETAERFDPVRGLSTPTGAPAHARNAHTATLLPNGQVLVAGGLRSYESDLAAEVYDPARGSFSATGPMNARRSHAAAALLPDGRVLIAGGVDTATNRIHATAEIYDPATGSFTPTPGTMSIGRLQLRAFTVAGGKVVIAEGDAPGGRTLAVEQFDPATGTFAAAGTLRTERSGASWTLLPDGRLLIAGGSTPTAPLAYLASAEIHDPSNGSTRLLEASLATARAGHTATLLSDGRVLLAGGQGTETLASLETFEPMSNTFSRVDAAFAVARSAHTATPLSDGRVLVSGGFGPAGVVAGQELCVP